MPAEDQCSEPDAYGDRVEARRHPTSSLRQSGERRHYFGLGLVRLLDSGWLSHRQIVLLYYAFCALFGLLTLITASQLFKFIAFGSMLVLIAAGFLLLARLGDGESSASS